MTKRIKLVETATINTQELLDITESTIQEDNIPSIIYPEIRAITANKITKNKTFYPTESLIGRETDNSGLTSITYPYPIPIIQDHATGQDGPSSSIYGRAKQARYVGSEKSGYVSVIAAITDPEAIRKILSDRFLTVSIGVETESVYCSICDANLAEGRCDHRKGQIYEVNGREIEAFLKIGPVYFQEISFVTVPSDTEAGVINKNVLNEGYFKNKFGSMEDFTTDHEKEKECLRAMWNISLKETKSSNIPIIILNDDRYKISLPIFKVNAENTNSIYTSIINSTFSEKDKQSALEKLLKYCIDNNVEAPKELSNINVENINTNPISIALDENTYPLLYSLYDTLEQYTMEVSMKDTKESSVSEEVVSVVEQPATDPITEAALKEAVDGAINIAIEETSNKLTEKYESEINSLKESINAKEEEISTLGDQISLLNEKCMESASVAHLRLATEVALINTWLKRPIAKGKTVEQVTKELVKRSTQSLEDSLTDLLPEIDGGIVTDLSEVEKITNPVINEEDTTSLIVDPATGRTTVEGIKEEEEESVFLTYGIKKEEIENKIKEHLSKSRIIKEKK